MNHGRSARRFIAQGLAAIFTGGTRAEAEAAFDCADQFIQQRGREASLAWLYLSFALLAVTSACSLLWLIFACEQTMPCWGALTCVAAGGIGAYLSRALADRSDLPCDANAGSLLHYQEALLRWSVGVGAGALLFLLVSGKVMLGSLDVAGTGFSVLLALALLAGVSERFLPTLLNRFNDQVGKENMIPQGREQKAAEQKAAEQKKS